MRPVPPRYVPIHLEPGDTADRRRYVVRMYGGNRLVRAAFSRNMELAMRFGWPRRGERWLDLGCGPGNLFPSLHAVGAKIIGVDLHPPFLQEARHVLERLDPRDEHGHSIVDSDVRTLRGVDDASIDGVMCLETLEHVVPVEAALQEVHRILKPGGRFVYSVPIEVGLALPMKEAARRVLRFPTHGRYSAKELVGMTLGRGGPFQAERLRLGGRVTNEHGHATHMFFDYKVLERQVEGFFTVRHRTFSPLAVPGPWSLSRLVGCTKTA